MLKPIEHILNNPNDLPDVPRAVKEYLQSRFNADFLYQSEVRKLRGLHRTAVLYAVQNRQSRKISLSGALKEGSV